MTGLAERCSRAMKAASSLPPGQQPRSEPRSAVSWPLMTPHTRQVTAAENACAATSSGGAAGLRDSGISRAHGRGQAGGGRVDRKRVPRKLLYCTPKWIGTGLGDRDGSGEEPRPWAGHRPNAAETTASDSGNTIPAPSPSAPAPRSALPPRPTARTSDAARNTASPASSSRSRRAGPGSCRTGASPRRRRANRRTSHCRSPVPAWRAPRCRQRDVQDRQVEVHDDHRRHVTAAWSC